MIGGEWHLKTDKNRNRDYYFNTKTQMSSWTPPNDGEEIIDLRCGSPPCDPPPPDDDDTVSSFGSGSGSGPGPGLGPGPGSGSGSSSDFTSSSRSSINLGSDQKAKNKKDNDERWKVEWKSQGGSYKNVYTGEIKNEIQLSENKYNILNYFLEPWETFAKEITIPASDIKLRDLIIYYRHLTNINNWNQGSANGDTYIYPDTMNDAMGVKYKKGNSQKLFFAEVPDENNPENKIQQTSFSGILGDEGLTGNNKYIMDKFTVAELYTYIKSIKKANETKKLQKEEQEKLKTAFRSVKIAKKAKPVVKKTEQSES